MGHPKFVAFNSNTEANLMKVKIENYSDIDWFDYESRLRKLMH